MHYEYGTVSSIKGSWVMVSVGESIVSVKQASRARAEQFRVGDYVQVRFAGEGMERPQISFAGANPNSR